MSSRIYSAIKVRFQCGPSEDGESRMMRRVSSLGSALMKPSGSQGKRSTPTVVGVLGGGILRDVGT